MCPLWQTVPRPPRVAWGVGANLPAPSGRAMSAPAPALRPPCGRPGSPSRPRRAALSAEMKGGPRWGETGGKSEGGEEGEQGERPSSGRGDGESQRRLCAFESYGVFSSRFRGTAGEGKACVSPRGNILQNSAFESVLPLKKVKREAAAQRRPAQSERKKRVFFAKRHAGVETHSGAT